MLPVVSYRTPCGQDITPYGSKPIFWKIIVHSNYCWGKSYLVLRVLILVAKGPCLGPISLKVGSLLVFCPVDDIDAPTSSKTYLLLDKCSEHWFWRKMHLSVRALLLDLQFGSSVITMSKSQMRSAKNFFSLEMVKVETLHYPQGKINILIKGRGRYVVWRTLKAGVVRKTLYIILH